MVWGRWEIHTRSQHILKFSNTHRHHRKPRTYLKYIYYVQGPISTSCQSLSGLVLSQNPFLIHDRQLTLIKGEVWSRFRGCWAGRVGQHARVVKTGGAVEKERKSEMPNRRRRGADVRKRKELSRRSGRDDSKRNDRGD